MERTLKIGDQEIPLRGTPLTLLFYKREFKTDLISDAVKYTIKNQTENDWDGLMIMQFVWAMAKTYDTSKPFPHFETWLGSLSHINFMDIDMLNEVLTLVDDALFRSAERIEEE